MKIEKKILANLERCYATGITQVDGKTKLLFATEGHGSCYQFTYPGFEQSTVWDNPGGTMSIIPIPGKNGDILAVQNFFPTFQSENATIVWATPKKDGKWEIKNFITLPYVHRFDLLTANGKVYFLGATLCTSKKDKEDWSDPGQIWCGVMPDSPEQGIELYSIKTGLVRNHGYCRTIWEGRDAGLVTADQGAFLVQPPLDNSQNWLVTKIIDSPISDIAAFDIDGDGEIEFATIEPFHGSKLCIRKKIGDTYEIVWTYDQPVDFGHAVWGGKLRSNPMFIFGYRKEGASLFYTECVSTDPLEFKSTLIDEGGGPSNIAILNGVKEDIIMCANRMIGDAVVYIITD